MTSWEEHNQLNARLVILRALAQEINGTLNSTMVNVHLETFGHHRSREWVHTQLRKLEELGAITLISAGSVLVATITRSGLEHVQCRSIIEGVARPSPLGA